MRNKIISAIFLIILACNQKESRESFQIDEIADFEINESEESFLTVPGISEINSQGVLLSFDRSREEFQLFDLVQKKLIGRVKVDFFGLNSIPPNVFSSLLFKDQIFVSTSESLAILNLDGEKVKEIFYRAILEKSGINGKSISVIFRSNWDPVTGDVFLWVKDFNSHQNRFQSYDEKIELLRYSLVEERAEYLELKVPENLIQENKGYYPSLPPLISVYGEKLVYAFRYLPEIYLVDLNTNETKEISIPPTNFKATEPIAFENYSRSTIGEVGESTQFIDLIVDPSQNQILRKHRKYRDGVSTGKDYLTVIKWDGSWGEIEIDNKLGRFLPSESHVFAISNEMPDEAAFRYHSFDVKALGNKN
ncbi:protein of unknown function [Algoriphagus hitonicola]|uniref:TolB-like 6-blade propeller-like n=1 Tax=Algoriphagus hitonicola TaxID=435880 RepID=A0A1I2UNI1_9BACT|nr:DUF4221 family protein [Algoriphagus hitonicola]SFG78598.1 protein of unknown function [Algoriphagus hitonicola]